MKRILLSLIAFVGVFANAFALDGVPAWKNDWTSTPAESATFYVYNKNAKKFIPKVLLDKNKDQLVEAEEAALWTKNSNCVTTSDGKYINMSSDNVWTADEPKIGTGAYDYTRNYTFTYSNNNSRKAFTIFFLGQFSGLEWFFGGYFYMSNDGGLTVKKHTSSKNDYYEWWLINEIQYDNHIAYAAYVDAVDKAKEKYAAITNKASKAWYDKHLVLDRNFPIADLSSVSHKDEYEGLTSTILAWYDHPEKYALLEDTKDYNSAIPAGEYNAIEVVRTLKAGWNTFCLPFDLPKGKLGDGAKIRYLYSVTNDGKNYTLNFVGYANSADDYIHAGTPYLVWMKTGGDYTFSASNKHVDTSSAPTTVVTGATFFGTYNPIEKVDPGYYIISDNKFWLVNGNGVSLNGFRGYFEVPGAANALAATFEDEEITGITSVNDDNDDDNYYNVAGQRVNSTTKGIIIKNGRKFVNK